MNRAQEIAAELERAIGEIRAEIVAIPDDRWTSAVTGPEGWRVGHAAHHIGEGYLQSLRWIDQCVRESRPVQLDPAVAIPAVNEENARCLQEHGGEDRTETMAFLDSSAQKLIRRVSELTDAQLDGPMMLVMGEARTGNQVALPMALRHATNHLQNIRDAQ